MFNDGESEGSGGGEECSIITERIVNKYRVYGLFSFIIQFPLLYYPPCMKHQNPVLEVEAVRVVFIA
jgi:hypothetical protein